MHLVSVEYSAFGAIPRKYEVLAIESSLKSGCYAHLTHSGMIVVDDIIISCYTDDILRFAFNSFTPEHGLWTLGGYRGAHDWQHVVSLPLRWAHRWLPEYLLTNRLFKAHMQNKKQSKLQLSAPLLIQFPGVAALKVVEWWR